MNITISFKNVSFGSISEKSTVTVIAEDVPITDVPKLSDLQKAVADNLFNLGIFKCEDPGQEQDMRDYLTGSSTK